MTEMTEDSPQRGEGCRRILRGLVRVTEEADEGQVPVSLPALACSTLAIRRADGLRTFSPYGLCSLPSHVSLPRVPLKVPSYLLAS
jgi:hypothetical protein